MSDIDTKPGRFKSLFFSVGNPKDFSPQAWKKFFVPFDADRWAKDSAGGIVYKLDDGSQFSLMFEYDVDLGLSMTYDMDNFEDDEFESDSRISVRDREAMSDFVLVATGATYPRGSFVDPEAAWGATEAFLNDPTVMPTSIDWLDPDELDWPEPG